MKKLVIKLGAEKISLVIDDNAFQHLNLSEEGQEEVLKKLAIKFLENPQIARCGKHNTLIFIRAINHSDDPSTVAVAYALRDGKQKNFELLAPEAPSQFFTARFKVNFDIANIYGMRFTEIKGNDLQKAQDIFAKNFSEQELQRKRNEHLLARNRNKLQSDTAPISDPVEFYPGDPSQQHLLDGYKDFCEHVFKQNEGDQRRVKDRLTAIDMSSELKKLIDTIDEDRKQRVQEDVARKADQKKPQGLTDRAGILFSNFVTARIKDAQRSLDTQLEIEYAKARELSLENQRMISKMDPVVYLKTRYTALAIKRNIIIAIYNAAQETYQEIWQKTHKDPAAFLNEIEKFNAIFNGIVSIDQDFGLTPIELAFEKNKDIDFLKKTKAGDFEDIVNNLLERAHSDDYYNAFKHLESALNFLNENAILVPSEDEADKKSAKILQDPVQGRGYAAQAMSYLRSSQLFVLNHDLRNHLHTTLKNAVLNADKTQLATISEHADKAMATITQLIVDEHQQFSEKAAERALEEIAAFAEFAEKYSKIEKGINRNAENIAEQQQFIETHIVAVLGKVNECENDAALQDHIDGIKEELHAYIKQTTIPEYEADLEALKRLEGVAEELDADLTATINRLAETEFKNHQAAMGGLVTILEQSESVRQHREKIREKLRGYDKQLEPVADISSRLEFFGRYTSALTDINNETKAQDQQPLIANIDQANLTLEDALTNTLAFNRNARARIAELKEEEAKVLAPEINISENMPVTKRMIEQEIPRTLHGEDNDGLVHIVEQSLAENQRAKLDVLACHAVMSALTNFEFWNDNIPPIDRTLPVVNGETTYTIPKRIYDLIELSQKDRFNGWENDSSAAHALLDALHNKIPEDVLNINNVGALLLAIRNIDLSQINDSARLQATIDELNVASSGFNPDNGVGVMVNAKLGHQRAQHARKQSFMERNPILSRALIGIGIGLAVAGAAAGIAVATGGIGLLVGAVGIVAAVAIAGGAGALITTIGGFIGGIVGFFKKRKQQHAAGDAQANNQHDMNAHFEDSEDSDFGPNPSPSTSSEENRSTSRLVEVHDDDADESFEERPPVENLGVKNVVDDPQQARNQGKGGVSRGGTPPESDVLIPSSTGLLSRARDGVNTVSTYVGSFYGRGPSSGDDANSKPVPTAEANKPAPSAQDFKIAIAIAYGAMSYKVKPKDVPGNPGIKSMVETLIDKGYLHLYLDDSNERAKKAVKKVLRSKQFRDFDIKTLYQETGNRSENEKAMKIMTFVLRQQKAIGKEEVNYQQQGRRNK